MDCAAFSACGGWHRRNAFFSLSASHLLPFESEAHRRVKGAQWKQLENLDFCPNLLPHGICISSLGEKT